MLWRPPGIAVIAVIIFILMNYNVRLSVSQEISVPAVDGCPNGWTLLPAAHGTPADNAFCVKYHPDPLPYSQARQVCKNMGTYLINHDLPTVMAFMDTAVGSRLKRELFGGLGSEREYWTGLHYDGEVLVWDGDLPSSPSLNIYCRNRIEFGSLWKAGWFCEDLNTWNVSVQSPCGSAQLSLYTLSPAHVPRLKLQDCRERKPFVCGGHFNANTYVLRADSKRCENGWFWNPYFKLCLKVFPLRASFGEAQSRCRSVGFSSQLFNGFDKEKQILLTNLFELSRSLIIDQRLWIDGSCQPVYYHSARQLSRLNVSCGTGLPYVCQAEQKNVTEVPTVSAEITTDGSLLCEVNISDSSPPVSYAYLAPNRTIIKSTEVSEGLPLRRDGIGSYQCIAYIEEASTYVYSNKVYHKNYPTQYHITMTLPINYPSAAPWNGMVKYYPQLGTDTRTAFTVLSYKKNLQKTILPAFAMTRNEIVDTGCDNCNSLNARITHIINIRNNVVPGKVSVTIKMYYYSRSLGIDGYFDLLNVQLRRNLITRLSLSREEAAQLMIVTPSGQKTTPMPGSPTPNTPQTTSTAAASSVTTTSATPANVTTTTSAIPSANVTTSAGATFSANVTTSAGVTHSANVTTTAGAIPSANVTTTAGATPSAIVTTTANATHSANVTTTTSAAPSTNVTTTAGATPANVTTTAGVTPANVTTTTSATPANVTTTTSATPSANVTTTTSAASSANVTTTAGVTPANVTTTAGAAPSANVTTTAGVTHSANVTSTTSATLSANFTTTTSAAPSANVTTTTSVTPLTNVTSTTVATPPATTTVNMTVIPPVVDNITFTVTSLPKYNSTASENTTTGRITTISISTTSHTTTSPKTPNKRSTTTTTEKPKVCQPTEWHLDGVNKTLTVPSGVEDEEVNLFRCVNSLWLQVKCQNTQWKNTSFCPIRKDISENALELLELSQETDNITDSGTAVAVLEKVSQKSNTSLKSDEVSIITGILTDIVKVPIENKTVLNEYYSLVFESVNNVLDADEEVFESSTEGVESSTRIIQLVDDLMHKPLPEALLNQSADIFEVTKPQLAFKLSTDKSLKGVVSLGEKITNESIVYLNSTSSMVDEPLAELQLGDTSIFDTTIRKAFVVYGSDKLHRSARKHFSPVNRIMSATLARTNGTPLAVKDMAGIVSITYNQKDVAKHYKRPLKCGYWVPADRQWSTDGCEISTLNGSEVVCSCNHLTDFSVLLDRRPEEKPQAHKDAMTYISFVGLIISSLALCCVVFTAILFKRLRKTNSQKVLSFLSLSLLGLNITFLIGRTMTGNHDGCVAIAAFLHYFLLSSFAWMFVEAILQYLRFVRVLGTYIPRFMIKASVPAFVIPALIVAITFAVSAGTGTDLYKGSDEYCWMKSEAMYYSVLIPIGLVLIGNTIIFGVVVANLVAARRRMSGHKLHTKKSSATLHLKAAIAVFIILGLTWIFGFLALIEESSLVFQYLFCIFNSLQGLLIFCSHNIREPKVQAAWLTLFRCNKSKQNSSNGQAKAHHKIHENKNREKVNLMTSSFSDSNGSSGSTANSTLLPQKST